MFRRLGFTMIELLIVISVLGILAVAVLAAINPIEQINRGKDTGYRSDSEQLLSGIDRYYAGKGYYPWVSGESITNNKTDPNANGVVDLVELVTETTDVGAEVAAVPMLTNLSTGGASELKSSFITRIVDTAYVGLSIYNNGTSGSSTYMCFIPKSSSFRDEAWKRCTHPGHTARSTTLPSDFPKTLACPDTACATAGTAEAATGCYSCLP